MMIIFFIYNFRSTGSSESCTVENSLSDRSIPQMFSHLHDFHFWHGC